MSSKRSYGDVCCVVNCKNRARTTRNIKYYSFSVNPNKLCQRQKWIRAVNRSNPDGSLWQPTKYSRICSAHFMGNGKSDHPLSPSFSPTIFPDCYKKKKVTDAYISNAQRRFKKTVENSFIACNIQQNPESLKLISQIPFQDLNDAMELETAATETISYVVKQSCVDEGTQVDFVPLKNYINCNLFICNRFVNTETCEAETQATLLFQTVKEKVDVTSNASDKKCGTDILYEDKCVGSEISHLKFESMFTCSNGFYGFNSITDDNDLNDIGGVKFAVFHLLLQFISNVTTEKLSPENRLLLFLMKMKLGLTSSALGVIFGVHRTTASRIFKNILQLLAVKCKKLVTWPSRDTINELMPESFKNKYGNCRVILDCTEFPAEQPPEVNQRVHFYSHYKKGFTVKVLIGCTPNGYISLISKTYGGRTTDSQITTESGLFNLLEPGDLVMADKGFPEIKSKLDMGNNVVLVMPPFLRKEYFTSEEVQETQEVASVRIHVERIMQRIKIYKILNKITINNLPYIDAIVYMAGILVNLQPPILKIATNNSLEQ